MLEKTLANSQYCLIFNYINCKSKKQRFQKNLNSFNSLTTEKINIKNIKVGAMTKLECEEYGHNVRNTATKRPILDF